MISVFKHHPMQIRLTILLTTLRLALLFILLVSANIAIAQSKVTSALIKQDTTEYLQPINDTLGLRTGKIVISPEVQAKSGNLAMLFSAVLPGAGQVYAHRYYTIPLIWGFGAYFASTAIKANDHYMDYRGKYSESIRLDTAKHIGNAEFLRIRDIYHNQRDEFIVYLALTYFLNIIDAYVGATLYDFNVSDDLGGNAKIQFRVPLR
jgi:hypothetical protein